MDAILGLFLILGTVCLVVLMSFVLGLYRAYWLHFLWTWFAVPVGLPGLSIIQLLGLMFILNFLQYKHTDEKMKPNTLFSVLLGYPMIVLFAYLFKIIFM